MPRKGEIEDLYPGVDNTSWNGMPLPRGINFAVSEAHRVESKLGGDIDTIRNSITTCTADVGSCRYEIDSFEKQNEVTQKLLNELLEEVKDLREEGERSQEQIDALTDRVRELEKELKEYKEIVNTKPVPVNLPSISPVQPLKPYYDPGGPYNVPGSGVWLSTSGDEHGHTAIASTA